MIKLVRIDDRLLHGQVAFTWVPVIGIDCILVANDKVAKDDFQKMTMGLAKPAGAKLFIKSIADSLLFLKDEKNNPMNILMLLNSVKDAVILARELGAIRSINFGGLRNREGTKQVSKAISLSEEDIEQIGELQKMELELEIRQVPSDQKIMLHTLI